MKIQNAFRFGLFGGLGVLVAIGIGAAIGTLATIITYIGAAIFLALGLDPAVSWLEKHRFPRWLAILVVVVAVLGVFTALLVVRLLQGRRPPCACSRANACSTGSAWRSRAPASPWCTCSPKKRASRAATRRPR